MVKILIFHSNMLQIIQKLLEIHTEIIVSNLLTRRKLKINFNTNFDLSVANFV
jgi:hypothetical protein